MKRCTLSGVDEQLVGGFPFAVPQNAGDRVFLVLPTVNFLGLAAGCLCHSIEVPDRPAIMICLPIRHLLGWQPTIARAFSGLPRENVMAFPPHTLLTDGSATSSLGWVGAHQRQCNLTKQPPRPYEVEHIWGVFEFPGISGWSVPHSHTNYIAEST